MVSGNDKLKIAIVSGATHALKYKEQNPNASDSEVLKHITNNAPEILKKMDNSEEEI